MCQNLADVHTRMLYSVALDTTSLPAAADVAGGADVESSKGLRSECKGVSLLRRRKFFLLGEKRFVLRMTLGKIEDGPFEDGVGCGATETAEAACLIGVGAAGTVLRDVTTWVQFLEKKASIF